MVGQNILPQRLDPIVATLPAADVRESLSSMHAAMVAAVQAMPTHGEFIRRYCASAMA
jgi:tryptophan halogenase